MHAALLSTRAVRAHIDHARSTHLLPLPTRSPFIAMAAKVEKIHRPGARNEWPLPELTVQKKHGGLDCFEWCASGIDSVYGCVELHRSDRR